MSWRVEGRVANLADDVFRSFPHSSSSESSDRHCNRLPHISLSQPKDWVLCHEMCGETFLTSSRTGTPKLRISDELDPSHGFSGIALTTDHRALHLMIHPSIQEL